MRSRMFRNEVQYWFLTGFMLPVVALLLFATFRPSFGLSNVVNDSLNVALAVAVSVGFLWASYYADKRNALLPMVLSLCASSGSMCEALREFLKLLLYITPGAVTAKGKLGGPAEIGLLAVWLILVVTATHFTLKLCTQYLERTNRLY